MAQTALEQLGINNEVLDQVKPEDVYEGKVIPSALYDAVIDKVYIRKTDSGANMLEVDFNVKIEDDTVPFHYSNCVLSGDEKGNKSTYTSKQGNEVALPGVISMTKFLTSIDSLKAPAVQGEVDHKGDKIKALCFTGLQGKKLKIGVIQEENFYQGDITLKNDVKYWLDSEGKNSVGVDLSEKVLESIEKHPLKKLRAAARTPGAGASTGKTGIGSNEAPKSNSGW